MKESVAEEFPKLVPGVAEVQKPHPITSLADIVEVIPPRSTASRARAAGLHGQGRRERR